MPRKSSSKRRAGSRNSSPYSKKSFIAKISDSTNRREPATFSAFPRGIGFSGQDVGEEIVLVLRRHPITLFTYFTTAFTILVVGVLAYVLAPEFFLIENIELLSITILLGTIILVSSVIFDTFVKWFYEVSIITTQRIVNVSFDTVAFHNVAEAQLEKVEDVYHEAPGLWSTVFDYGDVFIQTASAQPEFKLAAVPRPRDVQDTIFDLLELKQAGEI
ncbi:hypothetical protein GF357_00615 [Candidatus Dojkabacteria bacterium]|nr:hypothetical protein [Candidatus Dojkabacteria bacterium]